VALAFPQLLVLATSACPNTYQHGGQSDETWPSSESRGRWLAFFIESAAGQGGKASGIRTAAKKSPISVFAVLWAESSW
jgi:hypothetical protein